MRLARINVACRCCNKPVGVMLNMERHADIEEQHPGLVPMCDPCGEQCCRQMIAPSTLRIRRERQERRGGLDL